MVDAATEELNWPGFRDAIRRFAEQNSELSTPHGASMKCMKASAAFIDMLLAERIIPRRPRNWAVEEAAVVNGLSHYVVRVGTLCIDWTARQFEPSAEWPKMWVVVLSPGEKWHG